MSSTQPFALAHSSVVSSPGSISPSPLISEASLSKIEVSPPCASTISQKRSKAEPSCRLSWIISAPVCMSSASPVASSNSPPCTQTSSSRSSGPLPHSVSTLSRISNEFPTAQPRGWSIVVSTALVAIPMPLAASTIERARLVASARSTMNAALPNLTSRTRADRPSAAFFETIDEVISGTDATVPVTSLRAYILRSAGTRASVCPTIATPMRSTC